VKTFGNMVTWCLGFVEPRNEIQINIWFC